MRSRTPNPNPYLPEPDPKPDPYPYPYSHSYSNASPNLDPQQVAQLGIEPAAAPAMQSGERGTAAAAADAIVESARAVLPPRRTLTRTLPLALGPDLNVTLS